MSRFTLAYVHPGTVRHEFMDSVLRTLSDRRYGISLVQVESGTNVGKARNDCVRWFLSETVDDFLFFVDTDMMWSAEVPGALMKKGVPLVSALYLGRGADGVAFPVGIQFGDEGEATNYLKMENLPADGGLVEVAGIGMGAAMIRREVLETLGSGEEASHPDQWPFAAGQTQLPSGGFLSMSEDIGFCLRARASGFKSYIAPDVTAGHVKSFVMEPSPGEVLHV